MTAIIDEVDGSKKIIADPGMALCRKGEGTMSSISEVTYSGGGDPANDWCDCTYGDPYSLSEVNDTSTERTQDMATGVMLGGSHIAKAVSDDEFFKLMPEFASIRAQINAMHIDIKSKSGCNSCNKRRLHANVDGNFAAIASRLPDDRAKVLKKYLGIAESQPFYIRAVNPSDGKLILKSF